MNPTSSSGLPRYDATVENPEDTTTMSECLISACFLFSRGACPYHRPPSCFYFHHPDQRRRQVIDSKGHLAYWDVLCHFIQSSGRCADGDNCIFAHTRAEVAFHPARFRTRQCSGSECRGAVCCFAHSKHAIRVHAQNAYGLKFPASELVIREIPLKALSVVKKVKEGFGISVGSLNSFKSTLCPELNTLHERKKCLHFHGNLDRRRLPVSYEPQMCESPVSCAESCDKCHNRVELLYHPSVFKARLCPVYPEVDCCEWGELCSFAHSVGELRVPLLDQSDLFPEFFKTEWCPLTNQHDWNVCPYAHTLQDARRAPRAGYGPLPCSSWDRSDPRADYVGRCANGLRCPFAHGRKEQMYHPVFYKTQECCDWRRSNASQVCQRGFTCAFFHGFAEKRRPADCATDYTQLLDGERVRQFAGLQRFGPNKETNKENEEINMFEYLSFL